MSTATFRPPAPPMSTAKRATGAHRRREDGRSGGHDERRRRRPWAPPPVRHRATSAERPVRLADTSAVVVDPVTTNRSTSVAIPAATRRA